MNPKVEICLTCGQLVPVDIETSILLERQAMCSEYHVLCKICKWPAAKYMVRENGICELCHKAVNDREGRLKVV